MTTVGVFIPGYASEGDQTVLAASYNVTKNVSIMTKTQELFLVLAAYVSLTGLPSSAATFVLTTRALTTPRSSLNSCEASISASGVASAHGELHFLICDRKVKRQLCLCKHSAERYMQTKQQLHVRHIT